MVEYISSFLCGRLRRATCNMATCIHVSLQRALRESRRDLAVTSQCFCKLTSEVISHHVCGNVLVRSESLGPAHTQERIVEGQKYQDMRSWRAIYHSLPSGPQSFVTPHMKNAHFVLPLEALGYVQSQYFYKCLLIQWVVWQENHTLEP